MKSKKNIIYVFYFLIIFISIFISTLFTFKNVNNKVKSSINYLTQGGFNYTVEYQDNNFYTNETYNDSSKKELPGKLIDKINVNFDYHLNYSDSVKSDIVYSVNTRLVVENKYNKSYPIETNQIDDFQGKSYDLNYIAEIDYKHYKEIYNEYINEMGEAYQGNAYLSIEFTILNKMNYHDLDSKDSNIIKAIIPISEELITILKNSDISTNKKLIERVNDNSALNNFYSITSIFMWIISLLLILSFSLYHSKTLEDSSPFRKRVSKILREYDSIIVEVKRLPALDSYTVIETTTFSELLDAQSSLEMPINYKLEKTIAKFVIVKDDLAYVYYLKENKKV